jgi:exopolysaccharide biosynthesis polyprenyl glycosylphosphotransferase
MRRDRLEIVRNLIYVADLATLAILFFFVYFSTQNFKEFYHLDLFPGWQAVKEPVELESYMRAFWVVMGIWAVILKVRGGYKNLRTRTQARILMNQSLNGLIFVGAMTSFAFIFKLDFISRLFIALYTILSVLFLIANRLAVLALAHEARKKGYNLRHLLLVGTGIRAKHFIDIIHKHPEWGYSIAGILDRDSSMLDREVEGYKVIGTLDELPALLETSLVDEVVLVVPRTWLSEIEKSILYCEAVGIPITLSTDFFNLAVAMGKPSAFNGSTFLRFETRLLKDSELMVKRLFDIISAATLLLVSLPVLLVSCAAIRMTSKGTIIFKQTRLGRYGRKFTLYKLRSMVEEAETLRDQLEAQNEMSGPVFKIKNDPRVTPIGKFLRKTSLDEFPQLWNVIKGDMSLVGPRPPLPEEVEKYEPWQRRRLSMKPGITCIWQVSGRNKIGFEDWMKLDLDYIDRWSLWLDIVILFKTIRAVLLRSGA